MSDQTLRVVAHGVAWVLGLWVAASVLALATMPLHDPFLHGYIYGVLIGLLGWPSARWVADKFAALPEADQ